MRCLSKASGESQPIEECGQDGVVKSLNIGEYGTLDIAARLEAVQVNEFAFETTEKVLSHSVVVRVDIL